VEVLPGDVAAIARHIYAGHRRGVAVDAVAHAHAPTRHQVASGIGDIGARLEIQAHGTGTAQAADPDGIGMAVDGSDAFDGADDAATEDKIEVAGIDVADVLA